MSKVTLATVWLDGCSGCHMSFLDTDERIIDLLGHADLVYSPLVDVKDFPDRVDVVLIEGSVSTDEEVEKIQKIRAHSRFLIALGDCAVTGNVPAMRNTFGVEPTMNRAYFELAQHNPIVPTENLPTLLYAAKVARTPYLTPAGPDARALSLDPPLVAPGDPSTLHVTLDDTRFSNANGTEPVSAITAAEVYVDLAPWQDGAVALPLTADDGTWSSTIEAAHATLGTGTLASGRHILYVRGQDAAGDWGPVSALFLYVLDPATAPFVQGVVR